MLIKLHIDVPSLTSEKVHDQRVRGHWQFQFNALGASLREAGPEFSPVEFWTCSLGGCSWSVAWVLLREDGLRPRRGRQGDAGGALAKGQKRFTSFQHSTGTTRQITTQTRPVFNIFWPTSFLIIRCHYSASPLKGKFKDLVTGSICLTPS